MVRLVLHCLERLDFAQQLAVLSGNGWGPRGVMGAVVVNDVGAALPWKALLQFHAGRCLHLRLHGDPCCSSCCGSVGSEYCMMWAVSTSSLHGRPKLQVWPLLYGQLALG
jgi:hypothetical protein